MSEKLKLLYVSNPANGLNHLPAGLRESAEVVIVHNPLRALAKMAREKFDGDLCRRPTICRRRAAAAACSRTTAFWKACPTRSPCSMPS